MTYFYIPNEIAEDYKYVVPHDNYYDLYNTDTLNANENYTYYRFYNSVPIDCYLTEDIILNSNKNLNCIEITPTHEYMYRTDYKDIVVTSFIFILLFVFLINILTSIVKKGGVLSGLI